MPPSLQYHQSHRRPHSATTPRYDLSTKQYRIPQPQTYNRLKQNINKTFNLNKSAAYQDILQLTNKSLTNNNSLSNSLYTYHNKIQQLCTKYCIKPLLASQSKSNKQKSNHSHTNLSQSSQSTSFFNNNTPISSLPPDTDSIAKQFIKRESKQKQSLQRQRYLHQQINQQSNKVRVSSKKIKTEEFFKFTCENIRKLEIRDKENRISQLLRQGNKGKGGGGDDERENDNNKSSNKDNHTTKRRRRLTSTKSSNTSTTSSRYNTNNNNQITFFDKKKTAKSPQQQPHFHPYLKIYEQSQKQALQLILNNNTLNINYFQQQQLPVQINQLQEWEKYQKSVKEIYSGIKRMRYVHSAREMAKSGRIRARSGMQRERYEQNDHENDGGFYIT